MIALSTLLLATGLTLKTATGGVETIYPAKDRRATVVFVVLAECPIARGYAPEMARLARTYTPKGVRFVMAFADGTPKEWLAQTKEYGLPFPAARADRKLVATLKATAVPTAALIGPEGTLAYVGRIDDRYPSLGVQRIPKRADLRLALDAFLNGRKVQPSRTPVIGCLLPNG